MFINNKSLNVDAWALIAPKRGININRLYESIQDAAKAMGEQFVGFLTWKDMNEEKRKVILRAAELEGWTIIPVAITSAA